MSFFWSSWITIISLACWLFILGVLVFVLKYKPKLEEDGTTGHTYDGIQEYDRPLPKWWLIIFWGTLIWGLGYFVLYPSIAPGYWQGIATVDINGQEEPWTSANQLYSELQKNDETFNHNFETSVLANADATGAIPVLAKLSELQSKASSSEEDSSQLQTAIDDQIVALKPYVEKLSQSPEALKMGGGIFLQNCAVCHGSNAKGAKGYPNLTDNDWLYGGNADNILLTLHHGRVGGMPAWREQIGEAGVRAVAEYVLLLSGNQHGYELDKTKAAQGEAIFKQQCALCHGQDGKGMISAGAPNLTDKIWLYGGDRETVQETIRHGRAGVMPEWQTKLGNERLMLLAAYVYSLSDHNGQASGELLPEASAQ